MTNYPKCVGFFFFLSPNKETSLGATMQLSERDVFIAESIRPKDERETLSD